MSTTTSASQTTYPGRKMKLTNGLPTDLLIWLRIAGFHIKTLSAVRATFRNFVLKSSTLMFIHLFIYLFIYLFCSPSFVIGNLK